MLKHKTKKLAKGIVLRWSLCAVKCHEKKEVHREITGYNICLLASAGRREENAAWFHWNDTGKDVSTNYLYG